MSYSVLIVDDSKLARMSVAKALNTLHPDWTRLEAANGEEALAAVQASKVDIVLLDFNMPGRDGLAVAADLQRLNQDLPVALISANHQAEVVSRAGAMGATFLAKPLTAPALEAFLLTAIDRLQKV